VKAILHDAADEEFQVAINRYQAESQELGIRFYREAMAALVGVLDAPALMLIIALGCMPHLESQLKMLNPQEKRALADWLWRAAESAPDLSQPQVDLVNSRAAAALNDPAKRFPLGDAEKKLRR
jgi:hypothetical protein